METTYYFELSFNLLFSILLDIKSDEIDKMKELYNDIIWSMINNKPYTLKDIHGRLHIIHPNSCVTIDVCSTNELPMTDINKRNEIIKQFL